MRILLIRHGESTGNRDHLWAGITDHELTAHGFLQAQRLAEHLRGKLAHCQLSIHCSDLTRARRTAQAIADVLTDGKLCVDKLLREQDLGWREGLTFKNGDRKDPVNACKVHTHPGETKDDMNVRAADFIQSISPLSYSQDKVIVIVSHGLFLLRLYSELCASLCIQNAPSAMWSNTGVTTLQINKACSGSVMMVNVTEHLQGLKRTRGVGSAAYDAKQQKVSSFFSPKRTKRETPATTKDMDELDVRTAIDAIDAACASSGSRDG
ncbi:histidine phosphatase superfamily [Protomyces lactucae-debilis]|uniref:Histidine phosphatase superfamily n=1 Tax=Protomyces lactucae-debilis TaxID=2754530 RepID=A0A1Y2FGX3_PROLT|nr:histidine phosphatase superfamily [Protomyces lactucae-debilis]ORY82654.1 histidine phosphatase superfamily [Protomyces lactucae-debilis]